MSQFQLMREKRFRPFFFTQFLGAFNDNVFKTALITLVAFRAGQLTELDSSMAGVLLGVELPDGTEAYLAANDSAYLRCAVFGTGGLQSLQ